MQLQTEVPKEGKLIERFAVRRQTASPGKGETLGTGCKAAESLLTTKSCCLLCCISVFFTATFCPQNEPKQGRKVSL